MTKSSIQISQSDIATQGWDAIKLMAAERRLENLLFFLEERGLLEEFEDWEANIEHDKDVQYAS